MSDILEKAVEAAARAYREAHKSHQGFLYGRGHVIRDLRKAPGEQKVWMMEEQADDDHKRCYDAMVEELERIAFAEALAAALPHLASEQPQPSKSDEERRLAGFLLTRQQFDELMGRRAAALAECEAIARAEESQRTTMLRNGFAFFDNGAMTAASKIADAIAALRAPAEKEAEG